MYTYLANIGFFPATTKQKAAVYTRETDDTMMSD